MLRCEEMGMTVILFGIIRLMMHVTLVEINVHDDKVETICIDVFGRIITGSN